MGTVVDVFVPLDALDEPIERLAARALGWRADAVGKMRVLRRSLDARKDRRIGYRLRVEVLPVGETFAARAPRLLRRWPAGVARPRVVIVGSGPAGAWAALRLAEVGVPSVILERGKPVQPRRRDLATLQRGALNVSSNYCFGEGGAGTYSDGKLYTRSKDRAGVAEVLADLVRFGAPDEIEVESRPHVGSNRLPKVLTELRGYLEGAGVVYRFETELAQVRIEAGRVRAVVTTTGEEWPADAVVLAVGHSARPVYDWALAAGVAILPKDFAVGVRLEHPQSIIDAIQYGRAAGDPRLPPAFYELAAQSCGRGVYSFCMCPGGWIVPAATEEGGVVVNGMSLSKRDSPFANSGMVVAVSAKDVGNGPLAGVAFQRRIEEAAFKMGGGAFQAPGVRLVDFLARRQSESLPATSYRPGVAPAPLEEVFPPFVIDSLRGGLDDLTRRVPKLLHADAVLVAAETRTSAPVRMPRRPETLESPAAEGLYPAGEGAGYAGGIVSAALDGARVAEAIMSRARARAD